MKNIEKTQIINKELSELINKLKNNLDNFIDIRIKCFHGYGTFTSIECLTHDSIKTIDFTFGNLSKLGIYADENTMKNIFKIYNCVNSGSFLKDPEMFVSNDYDKYKWEKIEEILYKEKLSNDNSLTDCDNNDDINNIKNGIFKCTCGKLFQIQEVK